MIRLENINKFYTSGNERIHVIRNLNYTFPDTGLVFILGPSGSGKSTLLNLLGGLDKPDSGEIYIEDRAFSSFSSSERNNYLNSYLGFVFQEYNILKDLTLVENIKLSLSIQGCKRKVAKQKVKDIIDAVELTGLEKRKVSQLSGGQKQRIAIARALVKDPKMIIADEPTTALDVTVQAQVLGLMKNLQKESNSSIILVTHNLGVVWKMCDTVMVMYAGKTVEYADVKMIYSDARHPYTWGLLKSMPKVTDDPNIPLASIPGTPPDLKLTGGSCNFHNRCKYCQEICKNKCPEMKEVEPGHFVACHFSKEELVEMERRGGND
mgnify:CR=1 FL=1